MLTFYLIAGGLAVLAAAGIVRPLIAGRGDADNRDARDAAVFRDQLAEVERDLARGTITPDEAEGARAEVSRRLIAADQRARRGGATHPAPQGHSGLVAGLALVGTPALAAALYFGLGSPGVPDQPLATRPQALAGGAAAERPGQAEAEAEMAGQPRQPAETDAEYKAMVDRLQTMLADRPNDLQGHRLLANALMNLGRYGEAWRAYDKVIALSGGTVDAETRGAKAEGMILAAGGYVSPEAEAEIAKALDLDPALPIARYYGGLALQQAGRTDAAIAMWQSLRRDSPPDAPYLKWLDMMLADAQSARGGPAGGAIPGPTGKDIAAAEQLTPEQRAQMIDGMIARLDARLTQQGGTAEEWGRLMASYATLGRKEAAADAYRRALAALGDGPEADAVRAQAARLGLAPAAPVSPAAPAAPAAPQAGAPGPTPADMAAAAQMSPEERAAMVQGMVAKLEARLTEQGGSAAEWLRLIESYMKLDKPQEAARAYGLAAEALQGDPQVGFIKEQALLLGVPLQ